MGGFSSYDNLISAASNGQRLSYPWTKLCTTAMSAATWYSLFNVGGIPEAGTWGTTPSGCVPMSGTTKGSYVLGSNVSPKTKHLITSRCTNTAANGTVVLLVDQVAYYPINQSTSAQSFINTTPPSRYVAAGQDGLQVCLLGLAATGATSSNLTELGYIDQNGTSGQIVTNTTIAVTTSLAAPTTTLGARVATNATLGGPFLPLKLGNSGVRQLTYCKFSAANTGLHGFLLVRPLAWTAIYSIAGLSTDQDHIFQLSSLPRIHDSASLGFMIFAQTTTASTYFGDYSIAWN